MKKSHNIPLGWIEINLGDIIELEYGKGLPKKARNESGQYAVFGSNGKVGSHTEYLIEGPTIIVGRKGSAGAVHFYHENCWPIDTTYFVRNYPSLNLKFWSYLLGSLNLHVLDKSTAIPGLNRNDAYAKVVKVPPLNEQHRIVEKIEELFSELDNGIANLQRAQQQLKVYRQALLKAAFEGKLTEEWRKQNNPEPAEQLLERIKVERQARYDREIEEWKAAVKEWEQEGKVGKKPRKPTSLVEMDGLNLDELNSHEIPSNWIWCRNNELVYYVTSGSRDWKKFYSDRGAYFEVV